MKRCTKRPPGRHLIVLLVCSLLAPAAAAEVVVESVPMGSALARAGVRSGDVLDFWRRSPGSDSIFLETPLHFELVRVEEAPRGPLELHGRRHEESLSFVVEPGLWAVDVRPAMTELELRTLEAIRRALAIGHFEAAMNLVDQAAGAAEDREIRFWWWQRAARLFIDSRELDLASRALREANAAAPDERARALTALAAGHVAEIGNDLEAAQSAYQGALEFLGEKAPPSLLAARLQTRLGDVAWARGHLGETLHRHREALRITGALAPDSYAHGRCLNDVAYLAYLRGDAVTARNRLDLAHELLSRLAPLSNAFGDTLHYMGLLERNRGRLAEAQRLLSQALKIAMAVAPENLEPANRGSAVALRQRVLGELRRMQGDLALAEDHLRRAIEIEEKESPGHWRLALSLTALADVLDDGGRDALAERQYRRALALLGAVGNEFLAAHVLGNLATLLAERGELEAASRHFQRVLEIYRRLTPQSPGIAWALHQLGLAAQESGDLARAHAYLDEARQFLARETPQHVFLALTLTALGRLARQRDLLDEAERHFRDALEVYASAGAAIFEEGARHGLGRTLLERGQIDRAAGELERAVALLEDRLRRLGGSRHAQGSFRAFHREIYDDALAAELAAGRSERAYHLVERSRARSLLAMLAERNLDFALDLPPELAAARRDLERRQNEAANRALESGDSATTLPETAETARLREEQESLEARLLHSSPRFSAIRHPVPHGVEEARAALGPGTVLLTFNVASERTDLFVLTRKAGLAPVVTLPVEADELRGRVEEFVDMMRKRRDPRSPFFRSMMKSGRELFDLLIQPAAATIEAGERLLIVPDGALHQLPFAALIRPGGDYLAQWRPSRTVLSSTLHARLRGDRRPMPPSRIAAFGDPLYPSWLRRESEIIGEPRIRSAVRRGLFDWNALPHSRREIEALADLYPRQDVSLHLGAEATEEAVRALEPGIDLIHFAVHGHLDDRFPLNSALALTVPEKLDGTRHNGLLQAWEIFDSVRLDADLVVLSACSTALGQERGGEGLVGLIHAFHYAGARSILASLWNVSDRITAELMIRFHRHLRRGLAKDEALQAAQLELLEEPIEVEDEAGRSTHVDAAAPYYWAAFQVLGTR